MGEFVASSPGVGGEPWVAWWRSPLLPLLETAFDSDIYIYKYIAVNMYIELVRFVD